MCSCIAKRKERLGGGNYRYTFDCKMNDGSNKIITVVSRDDNQAKQLAKLKCEDETSKFIINRNETILKNNIRFVVEFIEDCKGNEIVKTFLLDEGNNIFPKSITVTCTCCGQSNIKVYDDDWCDCIDDKLKVVGI
jgi:hypothetical protein